MAIDQIVAELHYIQKEPKITNFASGMNLFLFYLFIYLFFILMLLLT